MADDQHLTAGDLIAALSHLPLDTPVVVTVGSANQWWNSENRLAPTLPPRPSWWHSIRGRCHIQFYSMWRPEGMSTGVLTHPDEREGDKPIVVLSL